MDERKTKNNKPYQHEIRCPVHGKIIGKYDKRDGITNVTYFCPACRKEYTFTIKGEEK